MAHTHHHNHSHEGGTNNIALAFGLNLSFTVIELIGGLLTNSVAILSDALHDFGDSVSLGMAWYFDRLSKKSPTARYTYGYKRFALLGALINATVLLVGSIVVVYECVMRLMNPEPVVVKGMFGLAILGILVNGIAVLKTRHGAGVNERVVSLHMLEDVLGWAAVLIVSIVMLFVDCPMLDPILSIGISCFVIYNAVRNLLTTLHVILQGVPENVDLEEVRKAVMNLEGVESVHDLHLWSLDSEYHVASLHAVISSDASRDDEKAIKQRVKQTLAEQGFPHVTVEIETVGEECTCYCNG